MALEIRRLHFGPTALRRCQATHGVPEFVHMGREKKEEEKLAPVGCFQGDHGNDLQFLYSFSSPCGVFSPGSRRYMCGERSSRPFNARCGGEAPVLRRDQPLKLWGHSGAQDVPVPRAAPVFGVRGRWAWCTSVGSDLAAE